jgi:acyl-CoA reductase-like NAD-dependent aldehyde dehydrogenase
VSSPTTDTDTDTGMATNASGSGPSTQTEEVRSPSDSREVVGTVPITSAEASRAALEASVQAQRSWAATPRTARGAVLLRAARILRERVEDLALTISSEMGKPLADARNEVAAAADFAEFYGGLGRMPDGDVLPDSRPEVTTSMVREPVGVVLIIAPWNDPLVTPLRKLGPALVSGNSALLKPSRYSPLTALAAREVFEEAGLPPDVLQVLTGPVGSTVNQILTDERLSAVSFTGSTATGRILRSALSGTSTRLQTEMGGKNATVVMSDADLDLAAETVASAAFGQCGQRCTATSRLLVHHSVASELVDRISALLLRLQPGAAAEESTTLGPVVSSDARSTMLEAVQTAVSEGAHLVTGGRPIERADLAHGWFLEPTVLTRVAPDMQVWSTELFGPVLAVTEFEDLDEAIALVNDSEYGLSAAIFTRDLRSAHVFARSAQTGQVAVNLPTSGWAPHLPFGGWKNSGSAHKEQGVDAIDFYTRTKTVAMNFGL